MRSTLLTSQELVTIHKLPLPKILELLGSTSGGLSEQQAQERLKRFGPNKLTEQKELSLIVKFLLQFNNFFSYLLFLGAALSFISEWLQPGEGSIFIAVALVGVAVLNACFTFIQKHKAEKAMKSFKNLMTSQVVVMRQEKRRRIDSVDLVPGEIILLSEGDKITADARLFEISGLKVNHSALTGESEPLLRSTEPTSEKLLLSRNMVLSGTLVQSGSGKAVVVATGDDTQIGRIAGDTREIGIEISHMQKEIGYFIKIISYIAIFLGVTFFLLGWFVVRNPFWTNIVFAIGIIVANVPEGLLPTVTLTLSMAAQRMAGERVLVKNIDSIETLGSVTIICSDKTGTLTENNLFVHGFYLNGTFYSFNREERHIIADSRTVNVKRIPGADAFNHILVLCNNSSFDVRTGNSFGDPTEICLKQFVSAFDNVEYIEKLHPRTHEIPFTSETRYMITANRINDHQRAHLKGAPRIILEKCSHFFLNGKQIPLSDQYRKDILARNEEYTMQGFRVLGVALKDISPSAADDLLEQPDYCFYGLIIMQDPPREEVPEAVRLCHQAGIRIFVISGDQERTVENIAQQVGIIASSRTARIITGEEMAILDDETLKNILQEEAVIFARTLPRDKLRIVGLLKDLGEIVAVTGDGVNDAPALRKADVGIAMGRSGTEVAKEAADIILLDDNFASIVHAIKFGRTVYDNIKSFILYILASNVPEIIPFLFFVLFGWPLALPVLLILCIDLGTDMLPAIGLGMEPSSPDIMNVKPRDPRTKILNWKMLARSYGFVGPLQTLFAYLIFFDILFTGGWSWGQKINITNPLYLSAVTAFFSSVVVTQIFNVFACRTSRTSVFSTVLPNRIIVSGIAAEILMIFLIANLSPFRIALGTSPFPLYYFGWMVGFGAVILLFEEGRKYLSRHYDLFSID